MAFWWFMFFCNVLVPVVQIVAGSMMWKHCPSKINYIYGYRTSRSMKNIDTWKFAHEHCGRIWWRTGWVVLIPSIFVQLPFMHSSEDVIGILGMILCTIQVFILIASVFTTERALKKTFDENGIRK